MQISAGSRVRNEHWLLGVKPTLAAGRDQFALHLTERACIKRLKKQGPNTCWLQQPLRERESGQRSLLLKKQMVLSSRGS